MKGNLIGNCGFLPKVESRNLQSSKKSKNKRLTVYIFKFPDDRTKYGKTNLYKSTLCNCFAPLNSCPLLILTILIACYLNYS